MKRALLVFVALAMTALGTGAAAAWWLLSRPYQGNRGQEVELLIEPGLSSREIAAELESRGVVRSRWLFLAARALRRDATLMTGEYRFDEPLSVWQVYERIARGRVILHPITIPEGLTRFEIAALVEEQGFASHEQVLAECDSPGRIEELAPEAKNLEGFLFPETYQLSKPFSAAQLVDQMVARFKAVYGELSQQHAVDLSPYEIVTLASLIEKETGLGGERKLVSSVFHNRLERGMLLQCDPTVIYGMILEDRYNGRLTLADLKSAHGYNTYLHAGLPPGPIANPGWAAIEAALAPAESGYLYFVAESAGGRGHVFSESLAAHNQAVAAYRGSRAR